MAKRQQEYHTHWNKLFPKSQHIQQQDGHNSIISLKFIQFVT